MKSRPRALAEGSVGTLGEEAGSPWQTTLMAECRGTEESSVFGAPQSGLTHLQTELSETFHCGPLGLFLLGSHVSGSLILYLKTTTQQSISSLDTTKRTDLKMVDI